MKNTIAIAAALLLSSGMMAKADRPLLTETPETVPVNRVVVEAGTTFLRGGNTKVGSFGELTVTTGIGPKTEVTTFQNYVNVRNQATGLSDTLVRVKHRLTNNLAVMAGTSIPTGNQSYRRNYQPGIGLAYQKSLGSGFNALGNVGYIRTASLGGRNDALLGSVALTKVGTRGGYFVEVGGAANNQVRDGAVGTIGAWKRVSDNFTVDARVGRSLRTVGQPNYFAGVGLTTGF